MSNPEGGPSKIACCTLRVNQGHRNLVGSGAVAGAKVARLAPRLDARPMRFTRAPITLAALALAAAHPAAADPLATATVGSEPAADPPTRLHLAAAAGAGVVAGQATSAVRIGAAVGRPWLTLAVAANLRTVGDRFATEDWNELADVAGVVHTLVVRNAAARARAALVPTADHGAELAAGALARISLGTGAVVDRAIPAIDARAHPGVHARLTGPRWAAELAIDDLAAPRLLAAAGRAPIAGWIASATLAADPAIPAPMTDVMATGAARALVVGSAGVARPITRSTWVGAAYAEAALFTRGGLGLHGGARGATRTGDAIVRARLELTAGTAGWTAAPFGPLHRVVATELPTRADAGSLGGLGAAGHVAVDATGLRAAAGARHRPGLGTELDAELGFAVGRFELAAWAAVNTAPVSRWALVLEPRVRVARNLRAGLDLGRLYRRDLDLDGTRGLWHALAWFAVDLDR